MHASWLPEDIMTDLTRRKMLTVAAATAASAVSTTSLPTPAAADDASDLKLFVSLSAALTGIAESKLAPAVDPIQIKNDYFKQAKLDPAFDNLMKIIRGDPLNPVAAAGLVMNNPDPTIKYLGRSIILAWYLGVWYKPTTLLSYNTSADQPFPVTPLKVVSPAAYTQGWTWRAAQAHPMGYSELRFGYWSQDPIPLGDLT
jgi:Membrane bound FAD containing D-sorbitol dehydrogenase